MQPHAIPITYGRIRAPNGTQRDLIRQFRDTAWDFANYQPVDGILVPFLIGNTEDGVVNSTVTISSVQWNYAVGPSDFALKGAAQ
jgi:hypothetical protein